MISAIGDTNLVVRVMPFIEQVSLSEKWDLSKPWHEHGEEVRTVVPDIFCALHVAAEPAQLGCVA